MREGEGGSGNRETDISPDFPPPGQFPSLLHGIGRAFHYSSQLQTWSKTWSQAGRKPAANLLKTVFSTFHLSSTRTNQRTCCGSRPGFRHKKVERQKLVESVSQTRTNLSKTWLQTWSKTRFAARFAAG